MFAHKSELDEWMGIKLPGTQTTATNASSREEIAGPLLNRILGIGQGVSLFRRNYVLRFEVRQSTKKVRIEAESEFELCNATDKKQPYVQELTVDDSEAGHVRSISFLVDGRLAYDLKHPQPTKKVIGYSIFYGPKQWIAPKAMGVTCFCRASWVIHRHENDIWYNHMVLPTVGIKVETRAPTGFQITPPYSSPELLMAGERIDIAWRKSQ